MPKPDSQSDGGENYYRRICEHAGVALISTDANLNIRVWNAAASRLFGVKADEMLGRSIASIIPEDRRGVTELMLQRTIETGEVNEFEFRRRNDRGVRHELAATVAPIVSESGLRIGLTICLRDISRFVAHQVEQYESRKLAALGQMAGMIAHHFNNIVGGVITSIDFASESHNPALKSRVLVQTSRALTRVTTLVHGLLNFAEGDQHSADLADFTEVLNDCADCIEESIKGSDIELILDLPELPVLPVPHTQMVTVLDNIMRNGIDAMPDGGTLRVEVTLEEDRILTVISDTGVGLDESVISRIFEPFWTTKARVSATADAATGLGLAIAHGIVQVMGGSIKVESEPKRGSSFTVSIPRPRGK